MALLRYFKPIDGLPDPKGLLSLSVPLQTIAAANREMVKMTNEAGKECGLYRRYTSEEHLEISRYTSDYSIAVATRYFSG